MEWIQQTGRLSKRAVELYRQGGWTEIQSRWETRWKRRKSAVSYQTWFRKYQKLSWLGRKRLEAQWRTWERQPKVSIVMPIFNPELKWLKKAIHSVQDQVYTNWEICLVDDASTKPWVVPYLQKLQRQDSRVKVHFRNQNGHISAATNDALALARGEYVLFFDQDDELSPQALFQVVRAVNEFPDLQLLYSDEDKIDARGRHYDPHFKPQWSPELFLSSNYLNHLTVIKRVLVKSVGGLRVGFEGSQDYDLLLRVVEKLKSDEITRLPYVLYHWRAIAGSTASDHFAKPYPYQAARGALQDSAKRRGEKVKIVDGHPGYHRHIYPISDPTPLVSLIIPTRDRVDLLAPAVQSLLEKTSYPSFEILIVNNQSEEKETLNYLQNISRDSRVRVLDYDQPFNWSAINNEAVASARGTIVGLLNNDIKLISQGWLEEMVGLLQLKDVGAVGAKLYYENDTLQHGGIVLGLYGIAAYAQKMLPRRSPGHGSRMMLVHEVSAVTGACLLTHKAMYQQVEGMDGKNLSIAFSDVDFCLKLREKGHRILWTPFAEFYHLESASRGSDHSEDKRPRFQQEMTYLKQKWQNELADDPYYNPNLSRVSEDFSLASPPHV